MKPTSRAKNCWAQFIREITGRMSPEGHPFGEAAMTISASPAPGVVDSRKADVPVDATGRRPGGSRPIASGRPNSPLARLLRDGVHRGEDRTGGMTIGPTGVRGQLGRPPDDRGEDAYDAQDEHAAPPTTSTISSAGDQVECQGDLDEPAPPLHTRRPPARPPGRPASPPESRRSELSGHQQNPLPNSRARSLGPDALRSPRRPRRILDPSFQLNPVPTIPPDQWVAICGHGVTQSTADRPIIADLIRSHPSSLSIRPLLNYLETPREI